MVRARSCRRQRWWPRTSFDFEGLAAIALGGVYAGAGAVIVGRAALAALGPATVAVRSPPEHLMYRMATMQTWRDFGAALGPLLSGFFLAGFAIFEIYLALVLILAVALLAHAFRRA